jgi:DNA-binding CsgD family transcriptional regulator
MENLAIEDTKQLHQVIQQLYTLHDLDTFGLNALLIVDRLVPSEIPAFYILNSQTLHSSDTFLPGFTGFTPTMVAVRQQYFYEHPIVQNMSQALNGACKISDFMTDYEFHSLEGLYQQYLGVVGMEEQMTLFLANTNTGLSDPISSAATTFTGFALHRSHRSFTERDRTILNLLRPHLSQAYANAQQYEQLQQNLSRLQQSCHQLGLVIINAMGQIQSIAPLATTWLEIYFTQPTCSRQLPDNLWSWVKHQVTYLTKNPDLAKAFLPLRIQQADRELVIRLVIEQPGVQYLLLLEEQTRSPLNSLAMLGLSQRETEVLGWIMQGKDNKSIANQLCINISTVRKHLENIYQKLGVQSRTEAIAQALTKLGFL